MSEAQFDNIVVLRRFSQLIAAGATFFQLFVSTQQMIGQYSQTVGWTSRNHPCGRHRPRPALVAELAAFLFACGLAVHSRQLFETLGHRYIFYDRIPLVAPGTGSQISGMDSLLTGAWRLEEEPECGNSGHFSSTSVRLRA